MEVDYKKSVAVFGLLLPMVFIVVCLVGLFAVNSRVSKEYTKKLQRYQQDRQVQQQVALLQQQVGEQGEKLERWDKLLTAETRRTYLQHWRGIGSTFKPTEFHFDLPVWRNGKGGLGRAVGSQSSSQVEMNFDATYRTMQQALLEMETKLPQMQLDSLRIGPTEKKDTLNFKTTFTVWTKE